MPSNDVFLEVISELEPEDLAATLTQLEDDGLIAWSEKAEQWTPTMRGLLIGIGLPAYSPGECLFDVTATAECA